MGQLESSLNQPILEPVTIVLYRTLLYLWKHKPLCFVLCNGSSITRNLKNSSLAGYYTEHIPKI